MVDAPYRVIAIGEVIMDWTQIVALFLAGGLIVYLAIALLAPEKFS